MFVANIGDAKAVVARSPAADSSQSNDTLKAIVLTREHKAIYPQERARIQKVRVCCCVRNFWSFGIMYILFGNSWLFMVMIEGPWYWERSLFSYFPFWLLLFGTKVGISRSMLVVPYFPIWWSHNFNLSCCEIVLILCFISGIFVK